MNEAVPVTDAELALHLFIRSPLRFGGIVLRGDGPARDAMIGHARSALAALGPVARIPLNVDSERLLGSLDLSATLAAGRSVQHSGILEDAAGGVVIVPMAERMQDHVAAHLAQAIDNGNLAALLLDGGCEPDEGPPAALIERTALLCDVTTLRDFQHCDWPHAISFDKVGALSVAQCTALAAAAVALGIWSVRPLLFADVTARARAALSGRTIAEEADIAVAVRLVLSPRATQLPESAPPPASPADAAPPEREERDDANNRPSKDKDLDDILLGAAASAIPKHVLDRIEAGAKRGGKGQMGRAGQKQKSARRGRPVGSRAGVPGYGRRLALIHTLRTAAPWQTIRRQEQKVELAAATDKRTIHIRKGDLRVRHYEQRTASLTIFAVDASGSSALTRLAEAKGAVEMMLSQAYVKRSQVALIAFRQTSAEILLPPTRSLTRARRALAALPGGGGTPLAAGLLAAQKLAAAAANQGQTPTIAMLTDGKGNVAIDGTADRSTAMTEAKIVARELAVAGVNSVVIDISPRPREEAAALAADMGGRYLPLPYAHSAAMVAAIESVGEAKP